MHETTFWYFILDSINEILRVFISKHIISLKNKNI